MSIEELIVELQKHEDHLRPTVWMLQKQSSPVQIDSVFIDQYGDIVISYEGGEVK